VMTPLVLELVTRLKQSPVPYLIAIATASNIGSVATITGNPQNIIIGSLSHIPYIVFAKALAPIAAVGLVIAAALTALSYRRQFFTRARMEEIELRARSHRPLLFKTMLVMTVMVVLFFLGQPVAKVAIVGGAFLLLTRRVKPEKIYIEIDWPLLVMFIGLFIVVGGLEKAVLTPDVSRLGRQHLDNMAVLGGVTAALSNIVSNVPAVLVLKSFVANLAEAQRAWLVIDGSNARRQSHSCRLGGQPYCGAAGESARGGAGLLELSQGRRAAHGHYPCHRPAMALMCVSSRSIRDLRLRKGCHAEVGRERGPQNQYCNGSAGSFAQSHIEIE